MQVSCTGGVLAPAFVQHCGHPPPDMPTMPFQVDQVDRQQSGPAAISAYSIALEGASPVKGLGRPPAASQGMPSSPTGGSRRTGASFLVREPSQSDVSGSIVDQTDRLIPSAARLFASRFDLAPGPWLLRDQSPVMCFCDFLQLMAAFCKVCCAMAASFRLAPALPSLEPRASIEVMSWMSR